MLDLSVSVDVPNTALFRGEGSAIVRDQLVADTEFAVSAIHGAVVPLTPVNQGFLRNAWGTKVDVTGGPVDVVGRVFDPLIYALPQERGAQWSGKWPRRDAIEAWVRRKLGVPDKEVRSVAFLVARKLKRVGMKGHAMSYRALSQVEPAVQARFRAGLQAVVERLGRR